MPLRPADLSLVVVQIVWWVQGDGTRGIRSYRTPASSPRNACTQHSRHGRHRAARVEAITTPGNCRGSRMMELSL